MLALSSLSANLFAEDKNSIIDSAIISQSNAEVTHFDGSVFYTYFGGETVGTKDAVTGVGVIDPGQEIHPPHKHAEEEYLMIIEGSGTWTLNNKEIAAKTGDIIYAAPWDLHGIKNTGTTTLKFVVMKWNSKGIAIPEEVTEE